MLSNKWLNGYCNQHIIFQFSVPGNENAPIDFVSPSGPVSYDLSTKTDDQPAGVS